jgi:uncharacterized protein YdaU (DUF1376 family)
MKKNIGKAPSIQFYYKDFLADMTSYGPELIGAWILILIKIWHESDDGGITDNLEGFSRICHTNSEKMSEILLKFSQKNIANVTFHNGDVTGEITVVNRRWKGELKLREDNRLRQNKHRRKDGKFGNSNANVTGDVTAKLHHSSSSSSSSINKKIYIKENPVTLENNMEYYNHTEQVPKPVNGELGKLMEVWAESINRDISQIPAKHRDGLDEWLPRGMDWCIAAIDWNKTQSPKHHTPASAFWNYAQHCRESPKEKTKPKEETPAERYERYLVKTMNDTGHGREVAKKILDAELRKYGMLPKEVV